MFVVPGDDLSGLPDQWGHLDGARAVASVAVMAAVRLLPVNGAAVLLMNDRTRWSVAAATDAAVTGVSDLELTLGEGPSVDAYASGGPVLAPDLAAAAVRWPILSPALSQTCAFFSFPLRIGAVRLGVLDLHRRTPGRLGEQALATALRLADVTAFDLVHRPDPDTVGDPSSWLAARSDFRPEVDQATGMLSVILDVDIATAYARLRGHAFAAGIPLVDVAVAVVAGTLHLDGEVDEPNDADS